MNLHGTTLEIGETIDHIQASYEIRFVPEFESRGAGWFTQPFGCVDQTQQFDGCLYTLDPVSSTGLFFSIPINRLIQRRTFQETVLSGSATWLAIDPTGHIHTKQFDQKNYGEMITYGDIGWANTWIARDKGATILNTTSPQFSLDAEEEIAIDSPSLPIEFWTIFHQIKHDKTGRQHR
jgi:hypothetical protein